MLGIRIREILKEKGISQSDASKILGKSPSCLGNWVQNRNDMSTEEIKNFCEKLCVSPNHLFGKDDAISIPQNIVKLDVLDVRACCGSGIANFQEGVIGHHFITRDILKKYTFSSPDNIKIIEAVGDSMTPTINPYDMLWIDISIKEPANDGMYLLTVGNELMIKRIQINPFNNQVQVKSDNPQYAPIVMENYHEIAVLGKVIYHMKRVG